MLTGFNTNVRHRGVMFHVQTEDSGRAHPHVITHLYHGGTILASEKRGYAELLAGDDVISGVRALMERLHKTMLERLQAGEFDGVISERLGLEGFASSRAASGAEAPTSAAPPPAARVGAAGSEPPPPRVAAPAAEAVPRAPRAFGEGAISGKPLDELVLEYLVESARKRKHSAR